MTSGEVPVFRRDTPYVFMPEFKREQPRRTWLTADELSIVAGTAPGGTVVNSPEWKADAELVEAIATMLYCIEANYLRETSGPGSRFEGQRLEVAQAVAVIRAVRQGLEDG